MTTQTTPTIRILLADPDVQLTDQLQAELIKLGYDAITSTTYQGVVSALSAPDHGISLVVLEVDMNGSDGRAILTDPARQSCPVILYSSRTLPTDVITGLDMGADDYLAKPSTPAVLEARIRAVLRRTGSLADPTSPLFSFDGLTIDTRTHEVTSNGEIISLTAKEFSLLAFMASAPRQVFSRSQLLEKVWSSSNEWQSETTVTEHIRRVRAKIEKDPDNPRWIITIPGSGYKFERRAPRPVLAPLPVDDVPLP